MVKEERAKGRDGIEGEGDMWNHFPYPCPSGPAHHKKLFQMKKSENANVLEAIRQKKKVKIVPCSLERSQKSQKLPELLE